MIYPRKERIRNMSRIGEALNKSAEEKKAQKKEMIFPVPPPLKAQKPPLEERLKNRSYVAKATDDSDIDPRIVTYFDPGAVISEQYRSLRTNILLNNSSKPLKTIVVCSSLQGEGKTVTAVNLAITMARDLDRSILLVDCDLRGGTAHQLLAINPAVGLADILTNDTALESAFCKTRIDNLTVLPRGEIPRNPSELLSSKKMRRLLEELRAKFDYIILDSPPVIPLADACILGSQVDGVIFIVQAHRTARRMVKQARSMLEHVHAKILGFVLTQTKEYVPKYAYNRAIFTPEVKSAT